MEARFISRVLGSRNEVWRTVIGTRFAVDCGGLMMIGFKIWFGQESEGFCLTKDEISTVSELVIFLDLSIRLSNAWLVFQASVFIGSSKSGRIPAVDDCVWLCFILLSWNRMMINSWILCLDSFYCIVNKFGGVLLCAWVSWMARCWIWMSKLWK